MKDNREESVWVRCPFCGGKTRIKVYEDTVLIRHDCNQHW
ncbi:cysteine-rich KTR domain-containing protein [Anaerotignum sp.]